MDKINIAPTEAIKEDEPMIIPNDMYFLIKTLDALKDEIKALTKQISRTALNG